MFWFIFAIFGVHLFRGKMAYCNDKMNFNITKDDCDREGKKWKIFHHNFENIFEATASLFIIATLDEWGPIL